MSAPLDPLFDALADGTRRRVLASIVDGGQATATQLAGQFPVTRQAIAKHLEVLLQAGVVTSERRGRETYYAFVAGSLASARQWIDALDAQDADDARGDIAAWQRHLEDQRARRGLSGTPVRAAATRARPPRA